MNQDELNNLFKFDFLKRTTLAAKSNYNNNTILELIFGSKEIKDLTRDGYYDLAYVEIGKVVEQVLVQLGNLDNDIRKDFPIKNSRDFNNWSTLSINKKIHYFYKLRIYDSLILKKLDDLRDNRNHDAHFNLGKVKDKIDKSKKDESEENKRQNLIQHIKDLHDVLLYFHKMYEKSNSSDTFFDAKLNDIYIPKKDNQKLHRNQPSSGNNKSSSNLSTQKTPIGRMPNNRQNMRKSSSGSNSNGNNSTTKQSNRSTYGGNYTTSKPNNRSTYDSNYTTAKPNYRSTYGSNYSSTKPSSSSNYSSSYNRTPHNVYSYSSSNYDNAEKQGRKSDNPWLKNIKIWGTIILVVLVLIPALNSCLDKYNASFDKNASETNTDTDSNSDDTDTNSDSDQDDDEEKEDPDLKLKKQFAGKVFKMSVFAHGPDNFKLGDEDVDFTDIRYFVPNINNFRHRDDGEGNTFIVFDSNVKSNKVVVTDQFSKATDAYRHQSTFNKMFAEQSRSGKNYYSVENNGFTLDIAKIKMYQYDQIGAYPTLFLSSSGMQKVENSLKNVLKNEDINNFSSTGDQIDRYDQEDVKEITLSGNDFEKYIKNKPVTVKYKFELEFDLLNMDDSDY